MDRKKHKNPVNGEYYQERDFLIGRTIYLGGFKFQLMTPDEYTAKYMEDNPEIFPEANIARVINKIKKGASGYNSLQEYVIELMRQLDKNGDGQISFDEFTSGLRR